MDEGRVNPFRKPIHLLAVTEAGSKVQDQHIRRGNVQERSKFHIIYVWRHVLEATPFISVQTADSGVQACGVFISQFPHPSTSFTSLSGLRNRFHNAGERYNW